MLHASMQLCVKRGHLVEGRRCGAPGAAALVGLRHQCCVRCLAAGEDPQPGALGIERRLGYRVLRLPRRT